MSSSKAGPFIIQGVVVIAAILIGIFIAKSFLSDSVKAMKRPMSDTGVLVEVVDVHRQDHVVTISGTGQVQASHTQNIKSEANGRLTWISPEFYPGAKLKKGTVIAKINTEEYGIKLSNAKIQLRQKEVNLMLEEAKGKAASSELETLKNTMSDTQLTEDEASLVKRQPQLQQALADVELAKNNVKQAQIDYDKSIVKCPYDAVVQTTNVSLGEYISGGTQLGTIIDSSEHWIYLSLNPTNVGWLNLDNDISKLKADVKYEIGGKTVTKPAVVKSIQPAVESLGRMVQVLLAVKEPMGEPAAESLLVGAFVTATIYAAEPLNSIELSRTHVREGNQAYVCTKDYTLSIRTLTTPFKTTDNVYVTDGLEDGDRVVTTLISSPVEGRKLRVKGEESETEGRKEPGMAGGGSRGGGPGVGSPRGAGGPPSK